MTQKRTTGRKPDWFRERCAEIIADEKLIDFCADVAAGRATEERLFKVSEGNVQRFDVRCSAHDRLEAFRLLAEWGVGKPPQYIVQASRTPEESKRNADEVYAGLIRLEQDAIARYRETAARR